MSKQTAVEWLTKEIIKHDKSFAEFYGAEIEQAQEVEYKRIREAIMYALDEDGHTGDWKIKFANDYINNLKQTK